MYATLDQPYIVKTPPDVLPLTVDEVKTWLKIPLAVTNQDSVISMLISAVTTAVEDWTKRTLINTEFETYRDAFGDVDESPLPFPRNPFASFTFDPQNSVPICIRRSLLQSVSSIEYSLNGVMTTLDPLTYRVIVKDSFSKIVPITDTPYPNTPSIWVTADNIPQAIKITFVAGYGDTADTVPNALKMAMLEHIAMLYKNRGDCAPSSGCSCADAPSAALMVYNQFRIIDFVL